MASRILKGDKVIVLSGKHKGETGTVSRVLDNGKLVLEGINTVKRRTKPNGLNQQGGIVEKTLPLFASKVALIDPKSGKATRIRWKTEGDNKVRIAAKSGQVIERPKRGE